MKKICVVLFSGGLDSRLAVKIMQEQGFEVKCLYFNLPFMKKEGNLEDFCKMNKCLLEIIDCSKGRLLQEYLKMLKKPKYARGAGYNPCIDCKIFIFKKAREFADKNKIELVVAGDVLGERPLSQLKNALYLIEESSGLKGRLLRPLSAKLLPETDAEKKGLVDRKKLYGIQGRRREQQIKLAEQFKIDYPSPGGGCLLCEKGLKKRFETLLKRKLADSEVKLLCIGRHFMIEGCWVILGRNKQENDIIESIGKKENLIIPEFIGPSAIILGKGSKEIQARVLEIIKAYSKQGSLAGRSKFKEYQLECASNVN